VAAAAEQAALEAQIRRRGEAAAAARDGAVHCDGLNVEPLKAAGIAALAVALGICGGAEAGPRAREPGGGERGGIGRGQSPAFYSHLCASHSSRRGLYSGKKAGNISLISLDIKGHIRKG